MTTAWRVMLNSSRWNHKEYETQFYLNPDVHHIKQSRGLCKMVTIPKKGDIVSFVCKGKIIMRGVVESDGFEHGTDHQKDRFNLGELRDRPHSTCREFARVLIKEVGLSIDIRPTGQRTWAKMPV